MRNKDKDKEHTKNIKRVKLNKRLNQNKETIYEKKIEHKVSHRRRRLPAKDLDAFSRYPHIVTLFTYRSRITWIFKAKTVSYLLFTGQFIILEPPLIASPYRKRPNMNTLWGWKSMAGYKNGVTIVLRKLLRSLYW